MSLMYLWQFRVTTLSTLYPQNPLQGAGDKGPNGYHSAEDSRGRDIGTLRRNWNMHLFNWKMYWWKLTLHVWRLGEAFSQVLMYVAINICKRQIETHRRTQQSTSSPQPLFSPLYVQYKWLLPNPFLTLSVQFLCDSQIPASHSSPSTHNSYPHGLLFPFSMKCLAKCRQWLTDSLVLNQKGTIW